jgi:hypothetical protein
MNSPNETPTPANPFARGDVSDERWADYVRRYYAERLRSNVADDECDADESREGRASQSEADYEQ